MVLGVSPCVSLMLPQLDVSCGAAHFNGVIDGDDYFVPGVHSSAMCLLSTIVFPCTSKTFTTNLS